jgi:phosphatidyl-myo-inositol dimannoside synthase
VSTEKQLRDGDERQVRVVILTPFYPPDVAGIPSLMEALAAELAAQGDEVRVLTVDNTGQGLRYDRAHRRGGSAVRVRYLSAVPSRAVSALMFLMRLFWDLPHWRPDVVVCGVGWPFVIVGLAVRAFTGVPYVAYFASEELAGPERSPADRWLLRLGLRYSSASLVISHFTAERLRRLVGRGHRPIWLPPPIATARFAAPSGAAAIRRRHGLEQRRVLLTVARLVDRKGQDTVIRVLPRILERAPNVCYLIVGSGPANGSLRQLARACGVEDHVVFAGRVAEDELPSYYQGCDIFLMLTRYDATDGEVEGFGMTLMEAAASGKPVIAGRAGGAPDAVLDGQTGFLVDPLDQDAVLAATLRLLEDPDLAIRMGTAGAERAVHSFDRGPWGSQAHDVLAAAVSRRRILGPVDV